MESYPQSSIDRTFTRDKFIEKSLNVHGEKYDYSLVEYTNSQTNVIIICKEHGEFTQNAKTHYDGAGCLLCASAQRGLDNRKTHEQFLEEVKIIHGNTYDYSKTKYIVGKEQVTIRCRIHGEFIQNANTHLSGHGCNSCGIEKRANSCRFTQDEFIQKAKIIHGEKYDYSRVEYVNSQTHVLIVCPKHGEFAQVPGSHLQGCGCDGCARVLQGEVQTLTTEEIVKRAKNVHGNKYDYTCTVYRGDSVKIEIKCLRCKNIFAQLPSTHIRSKCGCPICTRKTQRKLFDYLYKLYPDIIFDKTTPWSKNKRPDFLIPCIKIIIELDGRQHFEQIMNWDSHSLTRSTDVLKMKLALENGYRVIRIFQKDVFTNDEPWLDAHLKPFLNPTNLFHVTYISSVDRMYDDHIKDMGKEVLLKFVETYLPINAV